MDKFQMTGYMSLYAGAVNRLNGLKTKAKNMRENLLYYADPEATLAEIEEIEAEIKRREPEVDDLWCLAYYGKHRAELAQAHQYRSLDTLKFKPHWPRE